MKKGDGKLDGCDESVHICIHVYFLPFQPTRSYFFQFQKDFNIQRFQELEPTETNIRPEAFPGFL